jgi:hypothetical protein
LKAARALLVRAACGLTVVLAVGSAWSATSSVAYAQTQKRTAIALVSGGGGPEVAARLRAELSGIGWRVIDVEPGREVALAKIARRAGTIAVVRVSREGDGIEVWVGPVVAAEATSEWIDVQPASPSTAVVRAVEALRARFLELGIEPEPQAASDADPAPDEAPPASEHASRPPAAPPASQRAPASSMQPSQKVPEPNPISTPPLWLRAQAAALYSSGGLGLTPEIALGGQLSLYRTWSVGAELWFPPLTTEVEGDAGSARVRVLFAALSSEYRWLTGPLAAGLGAGVAVTRLDFEGAPATDYEAREADVVAWLPFARALLSLRISRRLLVRFDAAAGPSFPRVELQFAGEKLADWGRPLVFGGLGLEWGVGD